MKSKVLNQVPLLVATMTMALMTASIAEATPKPAASGDSARQCAHETRQPSSDRDSNSMVIEEDRSWAPKNQSEWRRWQSY